MGGQISRQVVEYSNEFFITASAGIPGALLLIKNGGLSSLFKITFALGIATGIVVLYSRASNVITVTSKKVVIITGCDTGLGFSLAQHMKDLGFTVIAAFLKLDSYGAMEMRRKYSENSLHQIELDLTQSNSVESAVSIIEEFFSKNSDYELHAVINNAGIMVFGEFEWLTEKLIDRQININLFGTMRITKALMPILRKYKGRLINVTSHCASQVLPGLSVYGATKAAIQGWSDGIRVEMGKYGVNVIQFIPGSFATQSHIMSRQVENVYEMHTAMTNEQHKFYGEYFKRYNSFLSLLQSPKVPKKIDDKYLYDVFEKALLYESPSTHYVNEPLRYTIYHIAFKYLPIRVRDYLVVKFMQMPEYISNVSSIPDTLA